MDEPSTRRYSKVPIKVPQHQYKFLKHRGAIQAHRRNGLGRRLRRNKGIYWGGVYLPWDLAQYNFLLCGAVGSGKTISLRLFMQSILPHIGKGSGLKAVIYDPKREMMPIIRGINPTCPIYCLNPFDRRIWAWNMAADLYQLAHAVSAAHSLSPPAGAVAQGQDFWRQAFIFIVIGVLVYFIKNAKDEEGNPTWTFRDLLLAPRSLKQLIAILDSDPETRQYLLPLQGERLTHSIMTTILVYLNQYSVVAALWEQASRRISLREFDQPGHEGILVLARDVENSAVMAALNSLMLTRLGQIQLMRSEERPRSLTSDCFWILDEIHTLGHLPDLEEVATTGRSKGISLAIAFQSIASLMRTYGHEATQAIVSQFLHRGILYLNDSWTAEYFSGLIGQGQQFQQVYQDKKLVETTMLETVPIVTPSDFAGIELPNKDTGHGLSGFYRAGYYNYWHTLPSKFISRSLMPKDKATPDFQKIEGKHQHLRPWDYSDLRRLGLDRVISPDDFLEHRREEKQQMGALADVSKGSTNISDILKKLDIDYNPGPNVDEVPHGDESAEPGQETEL